jgi:hypothetical protein
MAVRRAETPAGMREHYRCMGRRSGAAECKQSDVPRQPIDVAVMEYFAQVALDVEGTVAQLTGERDRRLAELDERLVAARKRERDADAELARCDALLREGLALEQWQRVVAPAEANKERAQADLDSLLAEREQVEATLEVADATGEFMERIAGPRAAVAGEVNSAEGIRATQVALRRVFDSFRPAPHRRTLSSAPGQRRANGRGELRRRAAGRGGCPAWHVARWNPGGHSLAAVAGTGQLTPVPPRPQ